MSDNQMNAAQKFYAGVREGGSDSHTASSAKVGFLAGWDAAIAAGYRKPVAVEGDAKDTLENLRRRADDKPGAIFNPAYDVGARFWFRKAADVIESQAAASARVRQWDRWRDARLFGDEGTPYSNGARDAHKAIVAILDASPEKGGQD